MQSLKGLLAAFLIVVIGLCIAPIGKSAILGVPLPALIPLLALFSLEVPIKDLLTKLLGILV